MPLADQGRQSWGPGVGHTPVFERVCVSGYSQYERPNSSSGNRVKVKSEKKPNIFSPACCAVVSPEVLCEAKIYFRPGLGPGHCWGAYDAPQTPRVG